ncbi:MAG: protein-export chaperone SecB [Pseudomonadota bacterium]
MSETPTPPDGAPEPNQSGPAALRVATQYLKDFSFENPQAPQSFQHLGQQGDMDVQISINPRHLGGNQYEVELSIRVTARREDAAIYVAEILYAGVFELQNIPSDQVEPVLLIECPRALFPFARRIIADSVRDGGYQQLYLDPIDFVALYHQRTNQAAQPAGNA